MIRNLFDSPPYYCFALISYNHKDGYESTKQRLGHRSWNRNDVIAKRKRISKRRAKKGYK